MQIVQEFLLAASSLLLLVIALHCFLHREKAGAPALLILVLPAIVWAVGSLAEIYTVTSRDKLLWFHVQQTGVFALACATIWFTAVYTRHNKLKLFAYGTGAVLALSVVLVFNDTLHGLLWTSYIVKESFLFGQSLVPCYTSLGWVLIVFYFFLPIVSGAFLLEFGKNLSAQFGRQIFWLSTSFLIPPVLLLFQAAFLGQNGIYISAFALFLPSTIVLFYSFLHYKFFSLSPIARDTVFEAMNEGILVMDLDGIIVDANSCAQDLLRAFAGITQSLVSANVDDIFGAESRVRQLLRIREASREELKFEGKDNGLFLSLSFFPLTSGKGKPIGSVLLINNITEQKLHEIELNQRANMDGLTKLLNRNGFTRTYRHMKNVFYKKQQPVSVFMMDLDNFKQINDTYGHTAGDKVLTHFSEQLRSCLRAEDIIGRMGGEEFSVILPKIKKGDAYKIAERMRKKIAESKVALSENFSIGYTVSIGITDNDDGDRNLEDILQEADKALYQAKKCSRNCTVVYSETSF